MIIRRKLYFILLVIPITLFHHADKLIGGSISAPIAEMFLQSLFSGNPERADTSFVMTLVGMFEITIFNLFLGTYIYDDLCIGGIYVLSRYKNRAGWLIRKTLDILAFSALYIFIYIVTIFLLCIFESSSPIDFLSVKIVIITFILFTFFTFTSTFAINVISVKHGSNFGFFIVYTFLTISTGIAISYDKMPLLSRFKILFTLNPMVNVVINWDISDGKTIMSIGYFILMIIALWIISLIYINRLDIGLRDTENNQWEVVKWIKLKLKAFANQ